ncbi:hypothetical protein ACJX0J_032978, partial [Zea mays]
KEAPAVGGSYCICSSLFGTLALAYTIVGKNIKASFRARLGIILVKYEIDKKIIRDTITITRQL